MAFTDAALDAGPELRRRCSAGRTAHPSCGWARATPPTSRPTADRCSRSSSRRRSSRCCIPPAPGRRAGSITENSSRSAPPRSSPMRQRLLVCGNEPGQAPRCYVLDARRGRVAPRHTGGNRRGLHLARRADRRRAPGEWRLPDLLVGGRCAARRSPGWANDQVVRWTDDGRALVVCDPNQIPMRAGSAGHRHRPGAPCPRAIASLNRSGLLSVVGLSLARDPHVYAYQTREYLFRTSSRCRECAEHARRGEESASE